MVTYSAGINKEQDKILLKIGELLYKQGKIPNPGRYALTKYLLVSTIETFKERVKDA